MKQTLLFLNFCGFFFAIIWLFKSNFDFEPIITSLGFISIFVSLLFEKNFEKKLKHNEVNHISIKNKIKIIGYLIAFVVLSYILILKIDYRTIKGIDGNKNYKNTININRNEENN